MATATTTMTTTTQELPLITDELIGVPTGKMTSQSLVDKLRKHSKQIFPSVPSHISRMRLEECAVVELTNNTRLLDCDPKTVFRSIQKAAVNSLTVGSGIVTHAFLVPHKGVCGLIVGYQGMLELARRGGNFETFACDAIVEGDLFEVYLGTRQEVIHSPALDAGRDDRPITHFAFSCTLKSGRGVVEVATVGAIKKHRDQFSPAAQRGSSPWDTCFDSMAKKTLILRATKSGRIPLAPEIMALVGSEGVSVEADEAYLG